MSEQKQVCPECKSKNVAWIFWGYPGDMSTIKEELDKGKIVLGGCIITNQDPKWECNECLHIWGKRDYD